MSHEEKKHGRGTLFLFLIMLVAVFFTFQYLLLMWHGAGPWEIAFETKVQTENASADIDSNCKIIFYQRQDRVGIMAFQRSLAGLWQVVYKAEDYLNFEDKEPLAYVYAPNGYYNIQLITGEKIKEDWIRTYAGVVYMPSAERIAVKLPDNRLIEPAYQKKRNDGYIVFYFTVDPAKMRVVDASNFVIAKAPAS